MQVATDRFGPLKIEEDEVLRFPGGLVGMADLRLWVLLADTENTSLGWLQSAEDPSVAVAVVNPRRFVPDYCLRISHRAIEGLGVEQLDDAQVLAIVGQHEDGLTLNLKAPLVFNIEKRLGTQVVAKDDHPIRYKLSNQPAQLKKTA